MSSIPGSEAVARVLRCSIAVGRPALVFRYLTHNSRSTSCLSSSPSDVSNAIDESASHVCRPSGCTLDATIMPMMVLLEYPRTFLCYNHSHLPTYITCVSAITFSRQDDYAPACGILLLEAIPNGPQRGAFEQLLHNILRGGPPDLQTSNQNHACPPYRPPAGGI